MSDVSQIDGNAVRLRRESQGWALSDLATRACLSVKQVRQIEEGGMTAFYSETVKLTAARKLAGLLEMTESQLFGQQLAVVESFADHSPEEVLAPESQARANTELSRLTGGLNAQNTPFTRSEVLHVLAQPPKHIELDEAPVEAPEADLTHLTADGIAPISQVSASNPSEDVAVKLAQAEPEESNNSSGYLLKILALFVVALAAAALLKPSSIEEKPAAPAAEAPVAPAPMTNLADNPQPAGPSEPTTPEAKPVDAKTATADVKSDATATKTVDAKPVKPLPKVQEAQGANPAPAAAETAAGK